MNNEQLDKVVDIAATLASRAEDIEDVMVIYTTKSDGTSHTLDNGMTVSQAVFLIEKFKFWLMDCGMRKERDGE